MVKRHLARLNMPRTWPLARKEKQFVTRPMSGHPFDMCIPLNSIIKEMLGYVKTAKEAKIILDSGNVIVNKTIRKDPKLGVGLMDVLEFPKLKTQFRMLLNKQGKLMLHPINEAEANLRPYKIINKTVVTGNKIQLNLDSGLNMLVKDNKYKTGDTLVIGLGKNEITEHLPLEKGAKLYITSGNKASAVGELESIKKFKGIHPDNIVFTSDGQMFETRKAYAFVIGKSKPIISLP